MDTKKILPFILAVLVVGGGATAALTAPKGGQMRKPVGALSAGQYPAPQAQLSSTAPGASKGTASTGQEKPAAEKTYSLSQVAEHSDASSCWTTIRGDVYDVTAWISKHPGGADKILGLCGKDGTEAFTNQHGGQRRQENELAGFKIGTLSK